MRAAMHRQRMTFCSLVAAGVVSLPPRYIFSSLVVCSPSSPTLLRLFASYQQYASYLTCINKTLEVIYRPRFFYFGVCDLRQSKRKVFQRFFTQVVIFSLADTPSHKRRNKSFYKRALNENKIKY